MVRSISVIGTASIFYADFRCQLSHHLSRACWAVFPLRYHNVLSHLQMLNMPVTASILDVVERITCLRAASPSFRRCCMFPAKHCLCLSLTVAFQTASPNLTFAPLIHNAVDVVGVSFCFLPAYNSIADSGMAHDSHSCTTACRSSEQPVRPFSSFSKRATQ